MFVVIVVLTEFKSVRQVLDTEMEITEREAEIRLQFKMLKVEWFRETTREEEKDK